MKASILFIAALITFSLTTYGQKAEVLYFKADLPCCQAKACSNMEAEIKGIVEKNFSKGNVVFKTIKISDPANKDIVVKYDAKSQSVVIIGTNKKKKSVVSDVSDLLRKYARSGDADVFESELIAKINESMK